jgi:drug/metabolite transporter (DMT)-like permease
MVVEIGRGRISLMQPKHWTAFIFLGTIWSASFLWIKIALDEIGPFSLVAFRVLFGVLFAGSAVFLQRKAWPQNWAGWSPFLLLGATSIAIPFLLITWGELSIDSAVAAILDATVPLFTIVIAHLFLHDDKMTLQRALGLIVGFIGVIILMSKDVNAEVHNSALGQAAVILASVFYAGSSVYARKTTQSAPGLVRGAAPLVSATVIMWAMAPVVETPFKVPQLLLTWIAILWLGVLGSGLALMLWYYLLHEIGPTRTGMVTYIFPLGGVILGVIFLNENLSWQLVVGALLIISSIIVVNWQPKKER